MNADKAHLPPDRPVIKETTRMTSLRRFVHRISHPSSSAATSRVGRGDTATRAATMASVAASDARTQGAPIVPLSVRLRTSQRAVCAVVGVVALLGAGASLTATPAQAASPWWHLTSGTRPANLQSGLARDEVQELKVEGHPGQVVVVGSEIGRAAALHLAEFPVGASPTTVEAALESEIFGAANVGVAAGPQPETYLLTFGGELEFQPVAPLLTGETEAPVSVTEISRGRPDGEIYLTAENLGDAAITGAGSTVELKDVLPENVRAVAVDGTEPTEIASFTARTPLPCSLESSAQVSCAFAGALAPYDQLLMRIAVIVEPSASTGVENRFTVSGGEGFTCGEAEPGSYRDRGCTIAEGGGHFRRTLTGPAPDGAVSRPITISGDPISFGIESYELANEEEGGGPATQAASHPFQSTTTIALNQGLDRSAVGPGSIQKPVVMPAGLPKDLGFRWPAGLLGNPSPLPVCSTAQFTQILSTETESLENQNRCPADTAVGVATTTVNEPATVGVLTVTVPLFNLEPHYGEPARFGFYVTQANLPVYIDTALRSDGDYGITVSSTTSTSPRRCCRAR